MPQKSNPQKASDRIPADFGEAIFGEIEDYSKHENFRKKVIEIFEDCTNTIEFKEKIKSHAGEAFNDKLFKNAWAILAFLGTLIVAGIIGRLIKWKLKEFQIKIKN